MGRCAPDNGDRFERVTILDGSTHLVSEWHSGIDGVPSWAIVRRSEARPVALDVWAIKPGRGE